MNFDINLQVLDSDALKLEYFFVPWDSELMARPVAQIQHVEVRDTARAASDFSDYLKWKAANRIEFAAAKIPHCSTNESNLIQDQGYRFIELNFKPEIRLHDFSGAQNTKFEILPAEEADKVELYEIASKVFTHSRFHLDSRLGPTVGNLRYETWMRNAFGRPEQQVIKVLQHGAIVAFFVQETPAMNQVFWSLVGLAPGLSGKGLGYSVWSAMLNYLQRRGVTKVSTSISSLNTAIVNLYVKLGFRFPEPVATYHWHSEL